MGTTIQIYLYSAHQSTAIEIFEVAFEEIERVEDDLSHYRPLSELSRLNRLAANAPVTTDPETFHLIERALSYSRRTGGAFDITVGSLMKAWGFFRDRGRHPSPGELARALAQTGWEYVTLDEANRAIRFLREELELDLGAVGKGYALDRAASLLRANGVEAALVGAGQSAYIAVGAPPGREGWPFTYRTPAILREGSRR
jgi:thiamine biosynthesis lipoprotein